MQKLMKAAAALAILGTLAAGCGGDDGGDGDAGATTTAGDGATTTTESSGDDGPDLGLVDDDCEFFLSGEFLNPLASVTSGQGGDIEDAADYLGDVADRAPDEIKDAMQLVAEGIAEMGEVLQDVDLTDPSSFTDPDVQDKIQELEGIFDEEYEAASNEVSTWIQENCGTGS